MQLYIGRTSGQKLELRSFKLKILAQNVFSTVMSFYQHWLYFTLLLYFTGQKLYASIWGIQDFFRSPNVIYESGKYKEFEEAVNKIVETFKNYKLGTSFEFCFKSLIESIYVLQEILPKIDRFCNVFDFPICDSCSDSLSHFLAI